MKQLALDLVRPPPPTLDNFVAGRNAELMQNLRRLAAHPTRAAPERIIYVWGMPGSGRSHLLRGVVAAVGEAGAATAYVECKADMSFDASMARMNCVAVDNAGLLGELAQIGLFNLYNALKERDGILLVSGNVPPVQLGLREDLVTRLGWGLVYQVHALSDDEKVQALTQHAAARGFRLSAEICAYLLQRVRRDMPSLLAMLDALDRYSMETKRQVTVPLVRELLDEMPDNRKKD
jgi:DnaA family protein